MSINRLLCWTIFLLRGAKATPYLPKLSASTTHSNSAASQKAAKAASADLIMDSVQFLCEGLKVKVSISRLSTGEGCVVSRCRHATLSRVPRGNLYPYRTTISSADKINCFVHSTYFQFEHQVYEERLSLLTSEVSLVTESTLLW
jgi:hypothetical protein